MSGKPKWFHFWNPWSGLAGGIINGVIIMASVYAIGIALW